jgi:hypothetical protein
MQTYYLKLQERRQAIVIHDSHNNCFKILACDKKGQHGADCQRDTKDDRRAN